MEENLEQDELQNSAQESLSDVLPVSGHFKNWFLDYASYVILERAVPNIEDGLKPVQRRILHAMKEMDDGRFNKVANIIGQTMQYHPHGDASIGEAIVNLGQKNLLIETQGNWGDNRTGDSAAAPRYIEARLSKFAHEVLYNPKTTTWQLSYDGRKKEPLTLPVKFPLVLAHGVEGIAVGLSTIIVPHNFIELCEASIAYLNGKDFQLFPDFSTGGLIDVSDYKDGHRGGKISIRARIEDVDKKMLVIKDIPFGVTTEKLINSIVNASDSGKIKIKKVVDNTAKDIEIQVHLAPGVSPDITIDALYAFTLCKNSISPNACIIIDDKPHFVTVSEVLKRCTDQTKELLKRELEIRKAELLEKILFGSLEKIFIENRIYRDIEECTSWEEVLLTIDRGLEPFKAQFYRTITRDDILRLTEIPIKRISKFDGFKADEIIKGLNEEMAEVEYNLANLTQYTIKWYQNLLKKYGPGRERKTEIRVFDTIAASVVAFNNQKLYVNRADGFIGYGLKKDEFISECSDLDDVIAFRKDGKYKIVKIGEKVFVGKDVIHTAVFKKNDERTTYNAIYFDAATGYTYAKRFQVTGVTRDKEYDITKGEKGSKLLYFEPRANGESEVVKVLLTPASTAKKKEFDFDFASIDVKGRTSQGNIVTKYNVKKVSFKSLGGSTLGGFDLFFDSVVGKLNTSGHGERLGSFDTDDLLLFITKDGKYELRSTELTQRFEPNDTVLLEKYNKDLPVNVLYHDASSKSILLKRFLIKTTSVGKPFAIFNEERGSYVLDAITGENPMIHYEFKLPGKSKQLEVKTVEANLKAQVKSLEAKATALSANEVVVAKFLAPAPEDSSDVADEVVPSLGDLFG